MKRILVFVAVMTMTALLVPAASAAGPILSITGGGTSENATFGPGTVRTVGFTAREYADDTFKGQVQVKNVLSNGVTISKVHGEVVCILKTSDVISGGQGYEIRYRITKSSGGGRLPPGSFKSLYVQDNPAGDQVGDNFSVDRNDPDCGLTINFGVPFNFAWDAALSGEICVHD